MFQKLLFFSHNHFWGLQRMPVLRGDELLILYKGFSGKLVLHRALIDWKFSVQMGPGFFFSFFFFDKYGFIHSSRIISREMFPHSDNILFLGDFNIYVCPLGPLSLDLFMSWAVFDLVLSLSLSLLICIVEDAAFTENMHAHVEVDVLEVIVITNDCRVTGHNLKLKTFSGSD